MEKGTAEDGGWEVIKRRRPRGKGRAPQAPKVPEKKGAEVKRDERSREEVLRAFGKDCERWRREWEGLGCREGLEGVMGRVREDLGIASLGVSGEEEKGEAGKNETKRAGEAQTEGASCQPEGEGIEGTRNPPETTKGQSGKDLNGSAQHSPGPGDCDTKDLHADQPEEQKKTNQPNGSSKANTEPRWPRRRSGLSRAVCLGLGSFEDEGWEVVRRTWVQYFAFLGVVKALDPGLPIIFQEPDFTPGDKAFLESRGHTVADDPGGFEAVADDPGGTVVVGFHLYIPIYRRVLDFESGDLPRVFVGTGWDVWDHINKGDQIPSLRRMHETYRSEAFPQDQVIATFSSTSIYWPPASNFGGEDKSEKNEESKAEEVAESVSEVRCKRRSRSEKGGIGAKEAKSTEGSEDAKGSRACGKY